MSWKNIKIIAENGEEVSAQAPVIISASRSTDIPAFYSGWFIDRFKRGYLKWKNPFNGLYSYVAFKNTRLIVFWSKNPKAMIKHLDYFDDQNINYYFQYTLNDYDKEKLEANVPSVEKRIETFIELSEKIGKEKVIWRFDPYILTNSSDVQELLKRTEYIGDKLYGHTEKLVFSFADINSYRKVENNLNRQKVLYSEFSPETMNELAQGLMQLNKKWKYEVGTCAEKIDLAQYKIVHNKCVDDDLMIKLFHDDRELMRVLGVKVNGPDLFNSGSTIEKGKSLKDPGQRALCGCIISKDIGQYNTCPHGCVYCYANTSHDIALRNYKEYSKTPEGETITGD
jgi:DNA repair photolyase